MAGQGNIDDIFRLLAKGFDAIHFPPSLQESLAGVLRNSDNLDSMSNDISAWRRNMLKQSDLSADARRFLTSDTTKVRLGAIPKIQDSAVNFRNAIESNADNIDVDAFMSKLTNDTGLARGDLAVIRSSFDELVKTRDEAVQAIMKENPSVSRQDVLDQWATRFESSNASRGASRTAGMNPDELRHAVKDALDELPPSKGPFSFMDVRFVKWKRLTATVGLGALTVAVGDALMGSPLSEALGRTSQKNIPVISYIASKMRGGLALTVDGVSYVMSAPAKALAATAVGALEERGEIEEGPEGDDQRALVHLIAHTMFGNVLPAAEIAFGPDLDAVDINSAIARAQSQDLTATEAIESVFKDLKGQLRENAAENEFGLVGSATERARVKVEEERRALEERARLELEERTRDAERRTDGIINRDLLADGTTGVTEGLSGLVEATDVSSMFNAASDNLDKLGVTGFGKLAFHFLKAAASFAGIFSKEAKEDIQRLAMSAFGIDEKISSLRDATANGRVVSQFGDRFGLGNRQPSSLLTADL